MKRDGNERLVIDEADAVDDVDGQSSKLVMSKLDRFVGVSLVMSR